MSLTFGGATGDDATKSTPTGLGMTSLASFTALGWLNVTTLTNTRTICRIGGSGGGSMLIRLSGATGNVQFAISGAVSLNYITSDTPLSVTSTWIFLACAGTIGTAGHIYTGTASALAAERTYGTAAAGTGPPTAETGTNEISLGNGGSAGIVALQGRMGGDWQVYTRELSLGEIQGLQFAQGRMLTGCKGWWRPGDTGTTTVTDYSGTGNHLTSTTSVLSPNPPTGSRTRRVMRAPYAVTVPAIKWRSWFQGTY